MAWHCDPQVADGNLFVILADAVRRSGRTGIRYIVLNPAIEADQAFVGRDGGGEMYAMFSTSVRDEIPVERVTVRASVELIPTYRTDDLPAGWPAVGRLAYREQPSERERRFYRGP